MRPGFLLIGLLLASTTLAQQGTFELPVQLIGFPVIIMAVRISNFLKKLTYAVNPNTYRSRNRRHLIEETAVDVAEVEKRLIAEMGERVCIYEKVCEAYAKETLDSGGNNQIFDWQQIFKKYETSPKGKRDFYLLSVFLGDIVGSPGLCHQLAKRGRSCGELDPAVAASAEKHPAFTSTDLGVPKMDHLNSSWGLRVFNTTSKKPSS